MVPVILFLISFMWPGTGHDQGLQARSNHSGVHEVAQSMHIDGTTPGQAKGH